MSKLNHMTLKKKVWLIESILLILPSVLDSCPICDQS